MPTDPLNDDRSIDALLGYLEESDTTGPEVGVIAPSSGHDRLILIPDSERVVACWRISSAGIARARAGATGEQQADLILRLYLEGAKQKKRTMDVELECWSGRYSIALQKNIRQVTAAIGFRIGEGFAHIVRAIPVLRPAITTSIGPRRWSRIDWTSRTVTEEPPEKGTDPTKAGLSSYVYGASGNDVQDGFLMGDGYEC